MMSETQMTRASNEERERLRPALALRHLRSGCGGHRVAAGIRLEIDLRGITRGPLRDPTMRQLQLEG